MNPRSVANSERGGIITKFIFFVFLLFILVVLYLVRVPLLRVAGRIWFYDDAPQPSDAIVPLGGDNSDANRAQRAAELYKQGYAPTVVASGRVLRSYMSGAEITEHDLKDNGVPVDHIRRLTHRADNTMEELIAIERLAVQQHWKKLLIVTSNYHTRRSHMLAQAIFPPEIQVRIISAPDDTYDPDHWWQHRMSQKIFLHELAGYIVGEWEVRRELNREENQAPSARVVPDSKLNRYPGNPIAFLRRQTFGTFDTSAGNLKLGGRVSASNVVIEATRERIKMRGREIPARMHRAEQLFA